jgi:IS5 family transposase
VYRNSKHHQSNFIDFNQPLGMKMNPNNRWVRLAKHIPWTRFEKDYAGLFKSELGNVAKPLRMALGALIIQIKYGYSDRELVEQLTESAYYQYFIGLPGYQDEAPFEASSLVAFRKRITHNMLIEANEYMLKMVDEEEIEDKGDTVSEDLSCSAKDCLNESNEDQEKNSNDEQPENKGTLILDATCAPSNIRYPQDYVLLNESRIKLEEMIDQICVENKLPKPRTYRKEARQKFLKLAKAKKRNINKIRSTIRKLLGYVKRNLGYLNHYLEQGYTLTEKAHSLFSVIQKLYTQQEYMYRNKTHSVENRIVSIDQPYLRPIVRGKAKSPVEFGAKFDLSVDEKGYGRIEKISFDAYNESQCLIQAIEKYKSRTGHYPERVLVDQIYRTRNNRSYCKSKGIRISGPKLGRPSKQSDEEREEAYKDNVDRIEVERSFSLSKRCYGMNLIKTKLEQTTMTTIALSVFVTNLFKILSCLILVLIDWF